MQQEQAMLTSKLAAWPYVTVVIDADGYYFRLLHEGTRGGRQIADELVAQVRDHISALVDNVDQCNIIVEAYANTSGLVQGLAARGRVQSLEELRLFWTGFVCHQPMFTYVDVGWGKENADQKIKGKIYINCHIP